MWLYYSFSSLDFSVKFTVDFVVSQADVTVLCFALNDVLPDYLTEATELFHSVIFSSSICRCSV